MEIKVPELGEGVESATVVDVLVKEGDQVEEGEDIIEVESDKAVAGLPSSAAGKISKLHVKEGDEVSQGDVVATLEEGEAEEKEEEGDAHEEAKEAEEKDEGEEDSGEEDEDKDEGKESAKEEKKDEGGRKKRERPAAIGSYERSEDEERSIMGAPASPAIRKLALQLGIDLTRVAGSERGGRITLEDLRGYVESLQRVAFQEKGMQEQEDLSQYGPIRSEPLSGLRKTISRRLSQRWERTPLVTQFEEADLSAILKVKDKLQKAYEKEGARLTVTAFFLKVLAELLKEYPDFNASLNESGTKVIYKQYIHLSVAVDTEKGLVAPVVRDADKKSLLELCQALAEISEKAREGKLSGEEMRGGSFTLSNQGGVGGGAFTPLLSDTASAILGVGGPQERAVRASQRSTKVDFRPFTPLCLSYDHRLIDGAKAARFVSELRKRLEGFAEKDARLSKSKKEKSDNEEG